jgi:GDP-mannose 6-dehydrogenase
MRISVIGLGYVGTVVSACLAQQGHHVICYDSDTDRLDCIKSGRSPIVEPGLADLIYKHTSAGFLTTANNISDAIQKSDLTFVCVGTPSQADGLIDLNSLLSACRDIGEALGQKDTYHTVVIRSTILPGTSEKYLIPYLTQHSGKTIGLDFGYLTNPEFLREGSAIADYNNPPKIVIGQHEESSACHLDALYSQFTCPFIKTSLKNAEAIKYVDNSWHAMKVGFANEMGNILKDQGIDSHEVMDIFMEDTHLNISRAYLKPGFAFGGSCLPKDIRAITGLAKTGGLRTPILSALLQANDDQIFRALQMIVSTNARNIVLLGLSFKAQTDDVRESPLLKLAEYIHSRGYNLSIYDPHVPIEKIPSLSIQDTMKDDIADELEDADLVIVGNNNPSFVSMVEGSHKKFLILDLVRLGNQNLRKQKNYAGICW